MLFFTIHSLLPLEITILWNCHCDLSACITLSQISLWVCIPSTSYFASLIQHGVGCNALWQFCLMSTHAQCHGRGPHSLPLVSSSLTGVSGGDLLQTALNRIKAEKTLSKQPLTIYNNNIRPEQVVWWLEFSYDSIKNSNLIV